MTDLEQELIKALQAIGDAARLEEQSPDSFDEPLYTFAQRVAYDAIMNAEGSGSCRLTGLIRR